MSQLKNYLSLVTFSHTIFAMPFAILGGVLGMQSIGWSMPINQVVIKFLLIILCMVFARSAAMAFNRYLDADIDARNERTKSREIPSGIISRMHALRFTILMSALFWATTYFINMLCFALAPVALFVILFYSYTKRFTSLCHLVLGVGLALAPLGAYMAVTESVNPGILLLSLSVLTWVSGFDVIYSLQDHSFDASQDLHSIPVRLGPKRAIRLSILLHIISVLSLVFSMTYFFGYQNPYVIMGLLFYIGVIVYQHSLYTEFDYSKVNRKFMTTNGMASLVFCVIIIGAIVVQNFQ